MEKLVILELDGDLQQGAVAMLEIRGDGNRALTLSRAKGKLPPATELLADYERWQSIYCSLSFLFRLERKFPQQKNQNCLTVRLSAIFKLPYMGTYL